MPKLRSIAAIAVAATALSAPVALAAPATVNVRVEGSSQTPYEGPVTTDAKLINDGTADRKCDGTNGGQNPTPGPTATGALDDASKAGGFGWVGSWNPDYEDFFVTKIAADDTPSDFSKSWALLINWRYAPEGGCHMQVQTGDDVLWAFTDYKSPLLQLTGAPAKAATGESFQVTVQQNDGNGTRAAAPGASVAGQTTDPSGKATVSFADPGVYRFKATRTGAIRSNAASVCVYAPGSGDCGTEKAPSDNGGQTPPETQPPAPEQPAAPAVKDTTPPVIRLDRPEDGKTYGIGPRELSGSVDETGGIQQVFLRIRATDGGNLTAASRCRWFSGKRSVFTHRTVPCGKARFFRIGNAAKFSYLLPARLRKGRYTVDVKVLDRAYNAGRTTVSFRVR